MCVCVYIVDFSFVQQTHIEHLPCVRQRLTQWNIWVNRTGKRLCPHKTYVVVSACVGGVFVRVLYEYRLLA